MSKKLSVRNLCYKGRWHNEVLYSEWLGVYKDKRGDVTYMVGIEKRTVALAAIIPVKWPGCWSCKDNFSLNNWNVQSFKITVNEETYPVHFSMDCQKVQNDKGQVGILGLVFAEPWPVEHGELDMRGTRTWARLELQLKGVGVSEKNACRAGYCVCEKAWEKPKLKKATKIFWVCVLIGHLIHQNWCHQWL